ncbi:hypothetical protein PENSPDRAFT_739601 [Peniophora sp. CONT]|nr:hypothetical protein PENSPDRAFT_739601 [Peniophora sp. CONT]
MLAPSDSSSLSSSCTSEFEPDSPAPPARPWKYLEHPDADEWLRGPLEIHNYPNLGDFVVLSIDPVATVGHLDAQARRAAQRIPARQYIALPVQSHGLPIHTKATHPYEFMFVRKGRPEPRLPDHDSQDSCIAILPNDTQVASHPPVRPAHPLPWDDCYLDATYGFPSSCRVTSTRRDYVPVLPIRNSEVIRIRNCFQPYWSTLHDLHDSNGTDLPQPFDFISLPSLPSLKDSLVEDAPVVPPRAHPGPAEIVPHHENTIVHEGDGSLGAGSVSDNVSIIASEDGDHHAPSESDAGGEEELDLLLNFESMMNDLGELRDPVVNVWYDLDVVTDIVDPVHFLEDVKRLHMIMDEAEIRLGLRPDPAAAGGRSEHSSLHDTDSQRSTSPSGSKVDGANVPTPVADIQGSTAVPLTPKPVQGYRARLKVSARRLLSRTRSFVRKLAFLRCRDYPSALTSRPWKYLAHPDAEEWMRGTSETQTWPNLGDFVVLSLNPVASVQHLDAAALDAARQIPVRKFLAATIETVGLPVNDKALHPYEYLFVRQGKPSPRLAGRTPDDECIAILPNDTTVASRAPIRPAHPLPWSDCYFDMTYGFPFVCRSSYIKRDYYPVLPMDDYQLVRLQGYVQANFTYMRQRFDEKNRPNRLSLVDASVDVASTAAPVPASPHMAKRDAGQTNPPLFIDDEGSERDDVSIIASDDHTSADGRSNSDSGSDVDAEELDLLLHIEAAMKTEGRLRDPVVDTWYDLDMITEIIDPTLFLQDVKRLQQIIDDAEARLKAQVTGTSPTDIPVNNALGSDQSTESSTVVASSPAHVANKAINSDAASMSGASSIKTPAPIYASDSLLKLAAFAPQIFIDQVRFLREEAYSKASAELPMKYGRSWLQVAIYLIPSLINALDDTVSPINAGTGSQFASYVDQPPHCVL